MKKDSNLLFVCDLCGTVDQIRTGYYPTITGQLKFKDSKMNKKNLCRCCVPRKLIDGRFSGFGTWHNKFPKKTWDEWNFPDVINKTKDDIQSYLEIDIDI